jgi:eukaryotic-like serine/threonine-protein kinase
MNASDPSNREQEIFDHALDLASAEERRACVQQACGDDAVLLARIQGLLLAHEKTEGFLPDEPAATLHVGPPVLLAPLEKPGDRIDRYKLLDQIGEGGCGLVYMAEQEEPIRRRVALKVIKLGMDTKSVIARFEAERQALALMDHPNIAKVFDAGSTDTGRPYFVMELVRGIKITDYCDQNRLSTRERLDLFIAVCHAVQHAHQKGIIHRDLKPSNILVGSADGVPVPKVIDFGIAKATGQQPLTDKTLFTAFAQFMGTPAYMSPEQAELSVLDIDTRSDIYSLGVLLYELLAGQPPFEPETLLKAGFDEMRRIIRETEPVKPSTRLTALAKEPHSALRTPHLREVRGDLDWIVMKCLEKDRRRRYETANELARDLERHLRQEPVFAAAPSRLYKVRKFVRRHRFGLATAGGFALILLFMLSLAAGGGYQRSRANQLENAGRAMSSIMKGLLKGVPAQNYATQKEPWQLALLTNVDRMVKQTQQELGDKHGTASSVYGLLAGFYSDLGEYAKAERLLRGQLSSARQAHGNEHDCVVLALRDLAWVAAEQGKWSEAESAYREALVIDKKLHRPRSEPVAIDMAWIAWALIQENKLTEAEGMLKEALAMRRGLLPADHPDVREAVESLALVFHRERKLVEAESAYREALNLRRKIENGDNGQVANVLCNLALVLRDQGKLSEAEASYREALGLRRKLHQGDHLTLIGALHNVGSVLHAEKKLVEAESVLREALAMRQRVLQTDPSQNLDGIGNLDETLFLVLEEQGKASEAEVVWSREVDFLRKIYGAEHVTVAKALRYLGCALRDGNKRAEAESKLRESLAMLRKLLGPDHPDIEVLLRNLAYVLVQYGNGAEAEAFSREALAMCRKLFGHENVDVDLAVQNLAFVLRQQGKLRDAEAVEREAIDLKKK